MTEVWVTDIYIDYEGYCGNLLILEKDQRFPKPQDVAAYAIKHYLGEYPDLPWDVRHLQQEEKNLWVIVKGDYMYLHIRLCSVL